LKAGYIAYIGIILMPKSRSFVLEFFPFSFQDRRHREEVQLLCNQMPRLVLTFPKACQFVKAFFLLPVTQWDGKRRRVSQLAWAVSLRDTPGALWPCRRLEGFIVPHLTSPSLSFTFLPKGYVVKIDLEVFLKEENFAFPFLGFRGK
jgi:hypothetical protein